MKKDSPLARFGVGWLALVLVAGCEISLGEQEPSDEDGEAGQSQGPTDNGQAGGPLGPGGSAAGGSEPAPVNPACLPTVIEEGTHSIGSFDGPDSFEYTVSIQVPAGARSFAVVASSPSSTASLYTSRLIDPQGATLYDIAQEGSPFRASFSSPGGPHVQVFPNSPELSLSPGVYQLTLSASEATEASIRTIVKPTCEGARAHLPVTFWFTGLTSGMNASKARNDPLFQGALATFRTLYGGAGIEIREEEVSLRDLSELVGAQQAQTLATPDDAGTQAIFGALQQTASTGLNYVLVDSMTLGGGQPIGHAGGIPGPPQVNGLGGTGVLCSVGDYYASGEDSGVPLGLTFAHEGGHYLGLFHTTERVGDGPQDHDVIGDTPVCSVTDPAGEHSTEVCASGGGSDNILFWAPQPYLSGHEGEPTFSRVLSPGQIQVLLHHPIVRLD